jgi:hypothetical protein
MNVGCNFTRTDMRMFIIIYGLGLLLGTPLVLITLHYWPSANPGIVATFAFVIVFLVHLSLSERKQTRTCPKCGEWWRVDRINRFDSSDLLLPPAIGSDISVIYKLKCKHCGHSWDVLTYETNNTP